MTWEVCSSFCKGDYQGSLWKPPFADRLRAKRLRATSIPPPDWAFTASMFFRSTVTLCGECQPLRRPVLAEAFAAYISAVLALFLAFGSDRPRSSRLLAGATRMSERERQDLDTLVIPAREPVQAVTLRATLPEETISLPLERVEEVLCFREGGQIHKT